MQGQVDLGGEKRNDAECIGGDVNGRKTTHNRRVHVEHLKGHSLRNMRCCTLRERIQSKLTKLYSIGIHIHLAISTL